MGRLGQLVHVDLRPLRPEGSGARWQVVTGFRRVEALRLLQRERVLARVHPSLADEDAWALALSGPLFGEPWTAAALDAIAARVRSSLPWAEPALAAARRRAAASTPPAATPPRDPAELAHQLAVQAYELNRELAAAFEGWDAVPGAGRRLVLEQLRYLSQLLPILERETR
jgi:ParB-like chromosome segregation protein Spo0J